jgi:hypothetical protein
MSYAILKTLKTLDSRKMAALITVENLLLELDSQHTNGDVVDFDCKITAKYEEARKIAFNLVEESAQAWKEFSVTI